MSALQSFAYVATPYTKFAGGIGEAFKLACVATAELIRSGIPAYSPIVQSHPVAIFGGLDPFDHGLWLCMDEPLMQAARALVVVRAEGWEESAGINAELEFFTQANRPIFFFDPGRLTPEMCRPLLAALELGKEAVTA
ncbi:MAG: hypothetical protein A3E01_03005 [Gammaproteobacteria bacterium RIFCSPHIGHO2_12_FULL_63_22]|nr:MAG: hypothetical protein A3E01_03005 [Gammaproteobacteria bacterium RIFCSPHIGHO2_12_FULL_63_22]